MNNKTLWLGLGIVIAVFLAWTFMSGNQEPVPAETMTEETATPSGEVQEEGEEAVEAQTVTVNGSEFQYDPSTLTLEAGVPVVLTFRNTGTMPHDFVIDELGIATEVLAPGEEEVVEFTPEAGTYAFYCSVGNHRALGMEGDLVVE